MRWMLIPKLTSNARSASTSTSKSFIMVEDVFLSGTAVVQSYSASKTSATTTFCHTNATGRSNLLGRRSQAPAL